MTTTKEISLNVAKGPSGRAMAEPMQAELVDAISQHLTMERRASAQYFANSIWFSERELRGFANFFQNESKSEQAHAQLFSEYLIARGQSVVLEPLPNPNQNWKCIEDIFAASFQMEADVTTSLHQLYSMAERSIDFRTTVFLDPVIQGQTSSEDEFAHLLGRVRFADNQPSAILIIDNELKA